MRKRKKQRQERKGLLRSPDRANGLDEKNDFGTISAAFAAVAVADSRSGAGAA